MAPEQMILPAVATLALGTALLVPLRDDRLGKRATIRRTAGPLQPNFGALLDEDAGAAGRSARLKSAIDELGARVRQFFTSPAVPLDDDDEARTESVAYDGDVDHTEIVERSFSDALDDLLPIEHDSAASNSEFTIPPEVEDATTPLAVIAHCRPVFDRIVPLTRMPLRPQKSDLSWPNLICPPIPFATESDRLSFLEAAVRSSEPSLERALRAAYHEEHSAGRTLALRALRAGAFEDTTDVFLDALHVGGDEERSIAIDALIARGHRDAVTFAFNDRVDAVAAQAALGYVGSYIREDYVSLLAPYCDRARIDTLLTMLAGIVE